MSKTTKAEMEAKAGMRAILSALADSTYTPEIERTPDGWATTEGDNAYTHTLHGSMSLKPEGEQE